MDENLFEEELTIEALSAMGNPLEQLSALVDFEMFRPELEDILVKKDCKSTAGRPQFDVVLMFKVIRIPTHAGPRSAARSTMAISSMPRQTRRPNSLRNT